MRGNNELGKPMSEEEIQQKSLDFIRKRKRPVASEAEEIKENNLKIQNVCARASRNQMQDDNQAGNTGKLSDGMEQHLDVINITLDKVIDNLTQVTQTDSNFMLDPKQQNFEFGNLIKNSDDFLTYLTNFSQVVRSKTPTNNNIQTYVRKLIKTLNEIRPRTCDKLEEWELLWELFFENLNSSNSNKNMSGQALASLFLELFISCEQSDSLEQLANFKSLMFPILPHKKVVTYNLENIIYNHGKGVRNVKDLFINLVNSRAVNSCIIEVFRRQHIKKISPEDIESMVSDFLQNNPLSEFSFIKLDSVYYGLTIHSKKVILNSHYLVKNYDLPLAKPFGIVLTLLHELCHYGRRILHTDNHFSNSYGKKDNGIEGYFEAGDLFENLLGFEINLEFSEETFLYVLNVENWQTDHENFKKNFTKVVKEIAKANKKKIEKNIEVRTHKFRLCNSDGGNLKRCLTHM